MAEAQINPRFMKYNKAEVEHILDQVAGKQDALTFASEETCRAIVEELT